MSNSLFWAIQFEPDDRTLQGAAGGLLRPAEQIEAASRYPGLCSKHRVVDAGVGLTVLSKTGCMTVANGELRTYPESGYAIVALAMLLHSVRPG